MKNNERLRIKILLSVMLLVIISIVTYISLPYLAYAIENVSNNFLENVGKITIPANKVTMDKEQIHEHRGYTVIANYSAVEKETYEQAVGKTGISDINSYISKYLSPATGDCAIGSEPTLGWLGSLFYNTSIFCQEHGIPFPSLSARVFNGFHVKQNTNRNEEKDTIRDYIEWCPPLACEKKLTIYLEDYKDDGIILRESYMSESDVYYQTGFKYVMGDFQMYTSTRVDYKAQPRNFNTTESYILTYSLRNFYKNNPAQLAIWKLKNGSATSDSTANKLYNSAKAVTELSNPTKPKMSMASAKTNNGLTYSTGTVIEGNNYKVGPIKMNGYSYGWTADIKGFSGESSLKNPKNEAILANKNSTQKEFFKGIVAGIIEAKVKLDNGDEIILDKDNFIIEGGSTNSGSSYYSYPTMADGYEYPTPNSKFYIKLPISECVGATKIVQITMTYKWHTADGNGGDLDGYYQELKWEPSGTLSANDTTYHCDNSYGGYSCKHDNLSYGGTKNGKHGDISSCYYGYGWDDYNVNANSHDFWCGTTGYCFDGENVSHRHCRYGGTKFGSYAGEKCIDCPGHKGSVSCGKYQHTHGTNCNSSDCYHTHNSLCCSLTAHTHGTSCYHSHKTSCYAEAGGAYNCGYDSGDLTCRKTVHKHGTGCNSSDCYHTHTSSCCSKYEHTHDSWNSRYDTGCYGTNYCAYAKLDYCVHGHQNGKHVPGECESWGTTHIDKCYGPKGEGTRCNAHPGADGGGHRNCATFIWKCMKKTAIDVQKLIYVSDAQVYEHNVECYMKDIPLITKVEIDKYIYDVQHSVEKLPAGVSDDTFGPSDERRYLDEETKKSNPVYVEANDYVVYKIIMKNSSKFAVRIKIDDILPASNSYEFISAYVGGTEIKDINKLREKIIQINAESEASATITIKVISLKGKYENKARIITRNGTTKNDDNDIDYIRTVEEDGPIVNHIETQCNGTTNTPDWESSDWFILNNYNAFIDKYVYKYDESKLKSNNSSTFTKETSILNESGVLKNSRVNKETEEKTFDDYPSDSKNLVDIIRVNKTVKDKNGKDIGKQELYKSEHPVNVEKTEKVTYAIRVYNDAKLVENTEDSGNKTPTKLKISSIEDKLHKGLKYSNISATIFNKDGTVKVSSVLGVGCSAKSSSGDYNIYNITTSSETVLEPGEYIEFYMVVEVVQSNMYLYEMKNEAKIKQLKNINDVDVTTRNISDQDVASEYLRMKDLVISGKVWVDFNKNGLMEDKPRDNFEKTNYKVNSSAMKSGVEVRLYRIDSNEKPELIRKTKTGSTGQYTFARKESVSDWYDTFNDTDPYVRDGNGINAGKYQRIDKANNKDDNGNYTAESQYYRYYVEFVYDGVVYKSTVYSGTNNLNADGTLRTNYKKDSNATELDVDREVFNRKYEYISYNSAFDINKANKKTLGFKKDGHVSYLNEDPKREMTAKSFVMKYNSAEVLKACETAKNSCGAAAWKSCSNHYDEWQVVIGMGLIDDSAFPNTTQGRKNAQKALEAVYNELKNNTTDTGNTQQIKYLWLYSYNESVDNKIPETEYLKYINLGLQLREDVDLASSKDVYSVTTTINGEEMEYIFNKGDAEAYKFDEEKSDEPYNTVRKPYALEIYESDYKYRVEQYLSDVVEEYKGLKKDDENQKFGTDELTIEVTYRINLQNKITANDAYVRDMEKEVEAIESSGKSTSKIKEELENLKEEKLTVKVHEVLDLYDENFLDLSGGNTIPVMIKNGDKLETIEKKVIEAWTYNGSTKVPLKVSTTSSFANRTINESNDGYKKIYISIPDGIELSEGEDHDVYIKFVVDKDALIIEMDKEAKKVFEETQETTTSVYETTTETVEVKDIKDPNVSEVVYNVSTEKTRTLKNGKTETYFEAIMRRTLKLAEKTNNGFKEAEKGGRGTENIAQINAYSVWYNNGKPASLVDKDSNAGNIKIGATSVDDTRYYEDMVYKTGIELIAEGSENSKRKITEKYSDEWQKEDRKLEIIVSSEPVRKIKGTVWDDARSNVITKETAFTSIFDVYDAQFVGNGKYNASDKAYTAYDEATKTNKIIPKLNTSIPVLYGDNKKNEEKDLPVRSVKAEYIEIVPVEKDGVTKYYEEVLSSVTWDQVQSDRTDNNGEYELKGFKPGNYIVRFTYGDTVDANSYGKPAPSAKELEEAQGDMQIFNGQDYKSTQYKGVSNDVTDVDKVIKGLEVSGSSDARDDEIRRLEVNSYSEVMTNEIAEILKGRANGNEKLAPTSSKNLSNELKTLTDNTYMIADTREFLVKTEKLTTKQTSDYTSDDIFYKLFDQMKNKHITQREFVINNVDFGIEYRPESQISLIKEIKKVTLITESNEILVDIQFDTISTATNKIEHVINKEKSIGFDKVKLITNYYTDKTLINNIISEEYVQGIAYLEVDEELLQGCTIKITYGFNAQNCSEVDRISTNLNNIRFKENPEALEITEGYRNELEAIPKADKSPKENYLQKLLIDVAGGKDENGGVVFGKYTASGLAKIPVFDDFYDIEENAIKGTDSYIVYRNTSKDLTTTGSDEYYGRYVGYGYYTGKLSGLDTIATLKFDKILDYIDTGLEYEGNTVAEEMTDKLWSKITSVELVNLVSKYKDIRDSIEKLTFKDKQTLQARFTELLNTNNNAFQATVLGVTLERNANKEILINGIEFDRVKDIDGIEYKSMVVSVNDRNIDDPDYGETVSSEMKTKLDAIKNKDISRFLMPKVTAVGLDGTDDVGKEKDKLDTVTHDELGYEDYTGHVYLDVSKVLASGANNGDYTYENMAEVVQFTTLTGRRTNFATTIGNADIHDIKEKLDKKAPPFNGTSGSNSGSIEFITASLEPDTSATETITLTPPTGLMKNRRAIVSIMETAKAGVEVMSMTGLVVVIVAIVIFLVILVIRKYKKRRIK